MNRSRWQQIEEIYTQVLEKPDEERARFLALKCSGDAALQAEVESLLSSSEECDDFLSEPDFGLGLHLLSKPHYLLRPEQNFGNYKILKFSGSGGMGEVYLAQDTRLDRRVALKLLPPDLTSDADRLRRFRQEARTASQIAHHNVAQIYEAGVEGDVHFIAMEFVDGITLRERLKAPLSFDDILAICEQIAAALTAAAEVGVVHRDLKPENVMLRRDKQVKVLDFGLAKLSPRYSALSSSPTDVEMSREISGVIHTEPGLLMGTATYMSPEQARGLPVDHRGDLWSLGIILYEMLTGHLPFSGETKSDIIAAILRAEPVRLKKHSPYLPDEAERIVNKALQKNREERYQTAQDLNADLQRSRVQFNSIPDIEQTARTHRISSRNFFKSTSPMQTSTVLGTNPFSGRRSAVARLKHYGIGLAAALLVLIGGASVWKTAQVDSSKSLPFAVAASRGGLQISALYDTKRKPGGAIQNLSFSPDGNSLAFELHGDEKSAVYVKRIGDGSIMKITDGQSVDRYPVWSSDGKRIAYISNRENKIAVWTASYPSIGGEPVLLWTFDAPQNATYKLKKLSNDGRTIFYQFDNHLYQLDLLSGQTKMIGSPANHTLLDKFSISPDEKMFTFISAEDEKWGIYVQSINGSETKRVVSGGDQPSPVWFPDNQHLIYSSDKNGNSQIYVVNSEDGLPTQITFGDSDSEHPVVSPDRSKIVFITERDEANIYSFNLKDKTEKAVTTNVNLQLFPDVSESKQLIFQTSKAEVFDSQIKIQSLESGGEPLILTRGGNPKLSPDAQSAIFVRFDGGALNLWKINVNGEGEKRLTTDGIFPGEFATIPYLFKTTYYSFSPSGEEIVYASVKSKQANIWAVPVNGGRERQLTANADPDILVDSPLWSPDGSRIAFLAKRKPQKTGDKIQYRLCIVENGREKMLFQTDAELRLINWSATGAEILVGVVEGGDTVVLKITADAVEKKQKPIARLPGANLHNVRLAPDERQIAFVARRDGRDNIFHVSTENGNVRQLTANQDPSLYYSSLVWSSDGQNLFYSKQTGGLQISMISISKN